MSGLPLLIEIGCEEVPAGVAPVAVAALRDGLLQTLDGTGIAHGAAVALGTPRRLVVHVQDVAPQQPDRTETLTGPPEKAAKDAAGNWTKAAEGFAKGQGLGVDALRIAQTPKGPYVALDKHLPGRPTRSVLADALPGLLRALPLPKRMRWGGEREAFVRPVHWIAALLGDDVIDVAFADVRSGRTVGGHRFWHPQALEITADLAQYTAALRVARVMVAPDERKAMIRQGIERLANDAGGRWNEDEATLDVVTWLVEWPDVLLGRFDAAFLQIPAPVIATTLRANQKLFTVLDTGGQLLPRFVAVANTLTEASRDTVAEGNAKVVSARLSDAQFFASEDVKQPLAQYRAKLAERVWLQGLGTVLDKADRVERLALQLADRVCPDARQHVQRAAHLCKADLATRMVFEFPELQGTVGADYARRQGEDPIVCAAVDDHYRPRFSGDGLPRHVVGAVVALADKIDTVVGGFAAGLQPSGSQDPFALRRNALGVLRILAEFPFAAPLPLGELVRATAVGIGRADTEDLQGHVVGFFRGRLEAMNAGEFPSDLVDAVLEAGFDDVPNVRARLVALDEMRKLPEFAPLATAFKRVANIVRKAGDDLDGAVLDPGLLQTAYEIDLAEAVTGVAASVRLHVGKSDWTGALFAIVQIKPAVDAFFDKVLVMAEDPAVRRNRLALLRHCEGLFRPIADFGRLQG